MPTTATVHVRHVLRAFSLAFSCRSCWSLVSVSVVVAPTTQGEKNLVHVSYEHDSAHARTQTHIHVHIDSHSCTHTEARMYASYRQFGVLLSRQLSF